MIILSEGVSIREVVQRSIIPDMRSNGFAFLKLSDNTSVPLSTRLVVVAALVGQAMGSRLAFRFLELGIRQTISRYIQREYIAQEAFVQYSPLAA